MRAVTVTISISAQDYLGHYQGAVKEIVARSSEGQNIRFPSTILQPFVNHDGVHGRFVISFDDKNKFQQIQRVG